MADTLADLKAQEDALLKRRAALEKPALEALAGLVNSDAFRAHMQQLRDLSKDLPTSNSAQNAANMLQCLAALNMSLPVDLQTVAARLAPPAMPGLPGGPAVN